MGFIFNGSGFQRRTYALSSSTLKNTAPHIRLRLPSQQSFATSSRTSHSVIDKRATLSYPCEDSQPSKKAKGIRAATQNGPSVTCGAKNSCGTTRLVTLHPSPQEASIKSSSHSAKPSLSWGLVNLPPEILYRIFCFSGLGKQNRIAHTCSYLHELFDFTRNDYLLEMLVRASLLLDLTRGTKTRDWTLRFTKKLEMLPESFQLSPVLEAAFHAPLRVAATTRAVDSSLFSFPGMNDRHVRFVHARFGGISVDRALAEGQRKLKRKYMEWRYMIFKAFAALANENPDIPAQTLLNEAESVGACTHFKQLHGLEMFVPLVESGNVPRHLYRHVTIDTTRVISELIKVYGMQVSLPALLVKSFYESHKFHPPATLDCLFLLKFERSATDREVAEALTVYQDLKSQTCFGEEDSSYAFDRYHLFILDVLTWYFASNPDENSSIVWEELKDTQSVALLNHVVGMGVSVPLNIF